MSQPAQPDRELAALIWAACDGSASVNECSRLAQRLDDEEAARFEYLRFVSLVIDLESKIGAEISAALLAPLPADSAVPSHATPRHGSTAWTFSHLAASSLTAFVFYGIFALFAWSFLSDRRNEPASENGGGIASNGTVEKRALVATLTDTRDLVWQTDLSGTDRSVGWELRADESLDLRAGVAEITFNNGAVITLEGPTHFVVQEPKHALLHRGKLVATIPPQAIGFTIETPTAKVVDLGTEFDVQVSQSGTTDVQVLRGSVELQPAAHDENAATPRPVTLIAGEARRIEQSIPGGALTVREIRPTTERFVAPVRAATGRRLFVDGTKASSEDLNHNRAAKHLIDGSGLNGDRHSNAANGTMWNSAMGKVKGEFVLFDLVRLCRLDSMKVWNCNEDKDHDAETGGNGFFKVRGVRQADIYVSSSGNGDPLSKPSEWQLIVADRQFSIADGTTNYSTPDVVPLKGIVARFVAIVIDAKFTSPADEKHAEGQIVALSEVQFFGLPVPKK